MTEVPAPQSRLSQSLGVDRGTCSHCSLLRPIMEYDFNSFLELYGKKTEKFLKTLQGPGQRFGIWVEVAVDTHKLLAQLSTLKVLSDAQPVMYIC